ncbi:MAG: 1-aminocyclopropane-1-carboxylate deaminase/D-cysteine desulfhydrase [Campylobacterota bacterium]|nr:1-aminocyclopropane-1-carboxylate deaminase/D-cysteine desulfhydrase [Campylobacterota bacterium]
MVNIINSRVDKINFKNREVLVKRDDLLDSDFSGNKARKFYYFLKNDFPNIDTIISYGSNQSNAMYSLSVLAKLKNWNYIYYTNHIPSFLEDNPQGNYKYALDNNMNIIVDKDFDINNLDIKDNQLLINEGGAIYEASYGLGILAKEIEEYFKNKNSKDIKLFLPSGTGTTALFLQKYLDIEVITTPCVGDSDYLTKQFLELEKDILKHPTIIAPPKKYHFGKLYKENYKLWKELKSTTDIEFDLLYDPVGWQTLINSEIFKDKDITLLYLHQGGIIGNETMVARYQYLFSKSN